MRILIAAVLGSILSGGDAAAERPSGCFVRTYDAAHLRAHPRQEVRRLWLRLTPDREQATFGLNIWVRGKPQIWRAGGTCDATGDGWTCRPDTDGASALLIARSGDGLRIENPGRLKIVDDETGPGLNDALLGAPGDKAFQLRAAAERQCRDPRS